jgi:hypothetical protein
LSIVIAMKLRQGFVSPVVILVAAALIILVSGVAVVAWRTDYLDPILPPTVKEFLGRGRAIPSSEGSTETFSESSEPTTEDLTRGWKTYTNTEFGFSFKYPSDWIVYPGVVGGILDHLGNYIVDLSSSPKDSGAELVYPVSPARLRVIYVAAGYTDSTGTLKAYENAEQYVRSGVLGSYDTGPYEGDLSYEMFGGRNWVEVNYAPDYGLMLYTEGSQKSIYAVYLPKDLVGNYLETVELVASTLALDF